MRSARSFQAACFSDREQQLLLYRYRGSFWHFRESCYRLADDETVRAAAWKFLDVARSDKMGHPPFKPTRSRVSDLVDALGSICLLDSGIDAPAWLIKKNGDPDAKELFSVANGLLHLPSGQLFPPTPRYFGFSSSDVVFDAAAPAPTRWLAFLHDLFGDTDAIATLQDFFGYTLSPDTSHQKIFLIIGPTRSGKGTIGRIHAGLMGRGSVAAPTLASLQTNFGLAPLIGKLVAIISDARLGARSDQAAIAERLLSISGEDAITIDRKFLPAWTGHLSTPLLLVARC
jgi:putative DNA primase/helicase